ncbi:unnamed protein product [Heterobilharzia americana]|nr:unnamed protein product [Heterobilharzia americana]
MLFILLDHIASNIAYRSTSPAPSSNSLKLSNHHPHHGSISKVLATGKCERNNSINNRHRLCGSQNLETKFRLSSTIQRNDGSNVSNHRSKSQPNDVQHQFDQFQDEVRQQLRDIRRECDSLKEMHLQLRNDWIKGQKCLTERFQTLMDELDEIKKLRANDAVELSRFRTILMQLDANSLINSQNHISLCDTGGEDKFCTGTDFLETLGTKPNQRSVNFKAITSHEDEEDHHSDQNDNICSSDNKMSLSTQIAGQKSSGKPSLRPRPVPAYGVTGSIRS